MNIQSILAKLSNAKKGSFKTVKTSREILTKDGKKVTKTSVYQFQANTNYANRKAVKTAVESGARDEVQIPAWAESLELDGVRFWRNKKSGQLYLPMNIEGNKPKTVWTDEKGAECDWKELNLYAKDKPRTTTKQELAEKGQAKFVAPKVETVTEIS